MKLSVNIKVVLWVSIAIVFVIMSIFIITRNVRINKLEKENSYLRSANDSLYINNMLMIDYYKNAMNEMDSIYKLSLISHEEEINEYWDSVYNAMLSDDNTEQFISDYLSELGSRKEKRSLLPR
jgi:hypothetical protein